MSELKKNIGILAPIVSLPSIYGVGDFGVAGYKFVDFLKENNFNIWQILPLNEVDIFGSPYASSCYFSIDEIYTDIDDLVSQKLLKPLDTKRLLKFGKNKKIKYNKIRREKLILLSKAYTNLATKEKEILNKFISKNPIVFDYAYFKTILNTFKVKDFRKIDINYFVKKTPTYDNFVKENNDQIMTYVYAQYLLRNQWLKLKDYANKLGVKILGDMPIYPSPTSFDIFSSPNNFLLEKDYTPKVYGGVPADCFSKSGQHWGTCVYDWDYLHQNKYEYLINKIKYLLSIYDILRLDHFIGYVEHYQINVKDKIFKWAKSGSSEFFDELSKSVNLENIVAEDLGLVSPRIVKIKDKYHLPGMAILQNAYGHIITKKYLPESIKKNTLYYLGTHDNMPYMEFIKSLKKDEKIKFATSMNFEYSDDIQFLIGSMKAMLKSKADFVIFQMQDILKQGKHYRTNTPGKTKNCWQYKIPKDYVEKSKEILSELK